MMATEQKHRCGGTLQPREVQVQDEVGEMLMVFRVPGLVCENCGEELIDREVMVALEKGRVPTILWSETVGTIAPKVAA
jgi:YgiT-type zinc finger domain-containing protein